MLINRLYMYSVHNEFFSVTAWPVTGKPMKVIQTPHNKLSNRYELLHVWRFWLIVLGFNDMSVFVEHFVSSPKRGRREIEEIVEEMKERDRDERNRNESEETEEIKKSPKTLTCYKDSRPCPTVSQYQLDVQVT